MEYNAITFLERLFEPAPSFTPDNLPGDWQYMFEERAGIMEYHGELPRRLAETRALEETVRLMGAEKKIKKALDLHAAYRIYSTYGNN